jgi:Acetyltransferase (GNAT) domain
MEVSRFAFRQLDLWSRFIDNSANGTIFHRHDFLDYHPDGRFEWHHLIFGNGGSPDAVLPAAIQTDSAGQKTLCTPAGATLGGPVLKPRLGLGHTVDVIRSLVNYATEQDLSRIVLGTVPSIYWRQLDHTLTFALRDVGFRGTQQLQHYVDLQALVWPNVIESIPGKRRYSIRKALKQGLQLKVAESKEEIAAFYELLLLSKAAHGAKPVHSLDEIFDLQRRLGQRLRIFTAHKDGRVVAGVYCVTANSQVCYTQYILDNPQDRAYDATRFILFQMLIILRQEGFRFLDLGPSVRLPIRQSSLALFKESLGAVGCERREWTLWL